MFLLLTFGGGGFYEGGPGLAELLRQCAQTGSLQDCGLLLLSRSRFCHHSVGGAWWHLGFYESF
jgi:hypothetical protein